MMTTCGRLAIVAALAGLPAHAPAAAAQATRADQGPKLEDVPKLTVRGEAQLDKPADQLRLRIGVVTEDPRASEALAANSRRMDDVVKAIRKAGLDKGEYETGTFSLQPVYSRRPPRPVDAEWEPKIVGYRVTNTLSIRTKKMDMAGRLIETANEAGANTIDAISFDLADPRTHRAEVIEAAARHARSDAAALARAGGVRLVRILSIALDEADWRPPVPAVAMGRGMAMAEAAAPPIEPGDVTVRASVTIVYEIGPGE